MWQRPRVVNHVVMCLQAHAEGSWVFCEQSTKWIFMFFAMMSELPELQRPQS